MEEARSPSSAVSGNPKARTVSPWPASPSVSDRPLQGANYAVAAERARPVLDTLRRGRSMAWIGALFGYPSASDLAGRGLPPGLWVQGVVPGSGADRAGLRDGDYVVALNRRPVGATLSGWCRAAAGVGSGDVAELELYAADGARRTVDVRFE